MKKIFFLVFLVLLQSCSFDNRLGVWQNINENVNQHTNKINQHNKPTDRKTAKKNRERQTMYKLKYNDKQEQIFDNNFQFKVTR